MGEAVVEADESGSEGCPAENSKASSDTGPMDSSGVRFTSRPNQYDVGGNFDIRIRESHHSRATRRLVTRDPYHSLLSLPLVWIIVIFVCCHVASWLLYVPVYMTISRTCDLGAGTFQRALYYSIM